MRLSASELSRFGEELGRSLKAPAVIGLSGELGTGKTTLIQAIRRGLGAKARATSIDANGCWVLEPSPPKNSASNNRGKPVPTPAMQ